MARKFNEAGTTILSTKMLQCDRAFDGADMRQPRRPLTNWIPCFNVTAPLMARKSMAPHGFLRAVELLQCDRAFDGAEIGAPAPAVAAWPSLQCDRAFDGAEIFFLR